MSSLLVLPEHLQAMLNDDQWARESSPGFPKLFGIVYFGASLAPVTLYPFFRAQSQSTVLIAHFLQETRCSRSTIIQRSATPAMYARTSAKVNTCIA